MKKDLLASISGLVNDFKQNYLSEDALKQRLIEKNPNMELYLKGKLPPNESKECEKWLTQVETKILGLIDKTQPIPFNVKSKVSSLFASLKKTARERTETPVENLPLEPLDAWSLDCSSLPTNGYEGLTVLMETLTAIKTRSAQESRNFVVVCKNIPATLRSEFSQWKEIAEKQIGVKLYN